MKERRAALLGFGNVAARGHWPAWRARRDVRIVAVADPDAGRRALARELIPSVRLYDEPGALLQREDLDWVDIAAPPARHAPLVAAAAAAGCHVLCEKPLATSVAEYLEARRVAASAGVTVFTVHNWKHSAQFTRVAALLADEAIGRLRHVRLEVVRNGRAVTVGPNWRARGAVAGGGILIDHGWHAFYLLLGLARERPQRISATLERRGQPSAEVEDTAACTVEFPSLTAEIHLTWAGAERRTCWQLLGEHGALTALDDRLEIRRGSGTQQVVFPQSLSAGSHHPEWFAAVISGFLREVDDRAVRGENLAEAERCLMLTSLAYASAAQGGRALPVPERLTEIAPPPPANGAAFEPLRDQPGAPGRGAPPTGSA